MSSRSTNWRWLAIEAYRELPATRRPGAERYFFVALAVFYLFVAVVGFAPEVYGSPDLAHPVLAYLHGALMMAWLVLFIVQTALAAAGLLKWHRTLGVTAVGLAVAIWISMGVVSVGQLAKFQTYAILLVQLLTMVQFGVFFSWGVLLRRDTNSHKRLLTLATLVLLQAAVDRMNWLPGLGLPDYWPFAARLYVLLIPLLVFDVVSIKRIHPITFIGACMIVAAHAAASLFGNAPGWLNLAHAMTDTFR